MAQEIKEALFRRATFHLPSALYIEDLLQEGGAGNDGVKAKDVIRNLKIDIPVREAPEGKLWDNSNAGLLDQDLAALATVEHKDTLFQLTIKTVGRIPLNDVLDTLTKIKAHWDPMKEVGFKKISIWHCHEAQLGLTPGGAPPSGCCWQPLTAVIKAEYEDMEEILSKKYIRDSHEKWLVRTAGNTEH